MLSMGGGNDRNSVPGVGKYKKPPDKNEAGKPYPRSTGSGNIKLVYGDAAAGGSTSS